MKKRSLKRHKGRVSQIPKICRTREGEYSLLSTTFGRITTKQLTSLIATLKRKVPTGTKIIPRVFATYPVTAKPLEVRMGSGKGAPEGWVAVVKPGKIMFEIAGVSEEVAREALRLAAHKLPIKSKFVKREEIGGDRNEG